MLFELKGKPIKEFYEDVLEKSLRRARERIEYESKIQDIINSRKGLDYIENDFAKQIGMYFLDDKRMMILDSLAHNQSNKTVR